MSVAPPDGREIVLSSLAFLAEDLRARPAGGPGLLLGWPGPALLLRALGHDAHGGWAGAARQRVPDLTLCLGEWGEAWAARQTGEPDPEGREALLAGYAARLIRYRIAHPDTRRRPACDLLYGSVGLGLLALASPAPSLEVAIAVVEHLGSTATPFGPGLAWTTSPDALAAKERERSPRGHVELSAAHGLASAVAFLGRAAGLCLPGAVELLDGALAALAATETDGGDADRFPTQVTVGASPRSGNGAWCRGDPGVALCLLTAGLAARRPTLVSRAAALAAHAARRDLGSAPAPDTSLCHGGAGLAWIYSCFYRLTREAHFARARDAWIRWTLDQRGTHGPGLGGFSTRTVGRAGETQWEADPSLLNGASGVGLCLLAATSTTSPAWEVLFGGPGPELLPQACPTLTRALPDLRTAPRVSRRPPS